MSEIRRNAAIPRLPVLGWSTFQGSRRAETQSISDCPHVVYTTTGRAAIALALRALDFKAGQRVLVPTYHCLSMISPVARLGGEPVFFPVTASGGPDLDNLECRDLRGVRAIVVAHYFGLVQPMSKVRAFCDARGIALIEDCAHAYFGTSEGRPVGGWGDFAIASLTKFFPVAEGGCLVSRSRSLASIELAPRGAIEELRTLVDALELGSRYRRLFGLNAVLNGVFGLKRLARGQPWKPPASDDVEPSTQPSVEEFCDVLLGSRLTRLSRLIVESAHRTRIVTLRQRNYRLLARLMSDLPGASPYMPELPDGAVPYVFPLRVERPSERYRALRAAKLPLFRWDRVWPGTPAITGDHGLAWAVEMLQLACHQDLSEEDVHAMAATVRRVFADVG